VYSGTTRTKIWGEKKRKQGKKELLEKYNSKTISGQKTCNKPTKKLNQLKQPR